MIIYSKIEKKIFFGFIRDMNFFYVKIIKIFIWKKLWKKKIKDNLMKINQNEINKEEKKFLNLNKK